MGEYEWVVDGTRMGFGRIVNYGRMMEGWMEDVVKWTMNGQIRVG